MQIQPFYDKDTATLSYVVADESTKKCAIIDSVLDYEAQSATTSTQSADLIIAYIQENALEVEWILETHFHADHLTAAQYLKQKLGGTLAMGNQINSVFSYWNDVYQMKADGKAFDKLFEDNETFTIGNIQVTVLHTPGHTPACSSYYMGDAVFVGDTLFKPESGTARADFPGGSAAQLYQSIQRIFSLPDHTQVYLCHDYPEANQGFSYHHSVLDHKTKNKMVGQDISKDQYIEKRQARDATLSVPRLLLPSLQVNMMGGAIPFQEKSGKYYLKIPLNIFN